MNILEQIAAAHSKVKSGADFPAFIEDLKKLGIVNYCTFVNDGHTDYFLKDGSKAATAPKYAALEIAKSSNQQAFEEKLKAHQKGQTDYPTFCNDAANSGVENWAVDTKQMTCTYFDKAGTALLQEAIPEIHS